MKKFVLNGIVLFLIMFVNYSFVYSQKYIAFVGTGYSSYCYNAVPGGTFQLQLVNSNCANTYSWSYNSGGGWNSISSSCTTGTSVTVSLSYPSTTTTYRCMENGQQTWDYQIIVHNPTVFSISGGNCCADIGDVTLNSSTYNMEYRLYKNGVWDDTWFSTGNGVSKTWYSKPKATYTVKAYINGCYKNMSGSVYIGKNCCKGTGNDDVELMNDNDIKVYPNPNSGSFYVEAEMPGLYTLYDELGRKHKDIVFTGYERIELSGLKPGLYFIRDESGNNISKISITEP